MPLPILYSLRRCPYCMRARVGLLLAKQPVMLRDMVMRNVPAEMLAASPKGTVPVLVLDNSSVIDESLDIMIWALNKHDPDNLLLSDQSNAFSAMLALINRNDNEFVESLEKYKVAARYHDIAEVYYREQCELFIYHLEQCLTEHDFFMGISPSLADYALLPFIRQFSRVDRKWYIQAPYPNLQRWLIAHYQNPLYSKAMTKYPQWLDNHEAFLFESE
ncbi:glutathione S-transferase [Photobacterium sagamiensis]|uniref:glutathione S-transferase n=1 Tax=Photobacterium sagamiensis TaxID=2910241 RepID=UPI003D0B4F3B